MITTFASMTVRRLSFTVFVFPFVVACVNHAHEQAHPRNHSLQLNPDTTIEWHQKVRCQLFDSLANQTYGGKVKYRGGMSSQYPKHSMSLNLDSAISLAELAAHDRFVLNASYIDKSFMRHKLSFDLFRRWHENNQAPQCNYAWINQDTMGLGLYVVMERLDEHTLALNVNDSQAMLFKEPTLFYPPDHQWGEGMDHYDQKFPNDGVFNRHPTIDSLKAFILLASDSLFYAEIGEKVDLANLIDWQLILQWSNNGDGVVKNFYWYKVDKETPFRAALWDCDHTWGRDGDGELNMLERLVDMDQSVLFKRLNRWPTYQTMLTNRWQELRHDDKASLTWVQQWVHDNQPLIDPWVEQNRILWPDSSQWYYDAVPFEAEVDTLLKFTGMSLQRMDSIYGYSIR